MIQHKDILDADRHEPKGASTASPNTVYVADGEGSGVFRPVSFGELTGTTINLATPNQRLVTIGGEVGGVPDVVYGAMSISNNINAFAVGAAVDPTLTSTSDYVLMTGTGAPWALDASSAVTFTSNRLTVPVAGVYRIDLWGDITSYPSSSTTLALRYRVNGTTFEGSKSQSKPNTAGSYGNMSSFNYVTLTEGAYIQLMIASTVAGGVVFENLGLSVTLIKVA